MTSKSKNSQKIRFCLSFFISVYVSLMEACLVALPPTRVFLRSLELEVSTGRSAELGEVPSDAKKP